jgi:predicted DNA-binding protein (MmcQ/YjbR family)
MAISQADADALIAQLRAFAMTYPGTSVKSPWPEHLDVAVKDKTFAFLPQAGVAFHVTVKLPFTGPEALERPGAAATGYGLGRSGWVTFSEPLPLQTLKLYVDESYRAVAPKSLVKQLGAPDL